MGVVGQGCFLLVPSFSGGRWRPVLHVVMLTNGSEGWTQLAGTRKAAHGQVKGIKPPFCILWDKMGQLQTAGGQSVGLLKHRLAALKLPKKRPGQRAKTYNGPLQHSGKTGKLVEKKLRTKPGRRPWVGTQQIFRELYQCI